MGERKEPNSCKVEIKAINVVPLISRCCRRITSKETSVEGSRSHRNLLSAISKCRNARHLESSCGRVVCDTLMRTSR